MVLFTVYRRIEWFFDGVIAPAKPARNRHSGHKTDGQPDFNWGDKGGKHSLGAPLGNSSILDDKNEDIY
jgi:hypothetical protein